MSTPISSLTASGLTSLLNGMISQLSGQPVPPGSTHAHLSALAVLGAAASSSVASTSSASSTVSSSSTSISILQGGHTNSVLSLALNVSGTLLASGGEDGYLCIWLTSENRLLSRRAVIHGSIQSALQPNGNLHQTNSSRLANPSASNSTRGSRHHATAYAQVHSSAISLIAAPIRHLVFANRLENERRLFVACGCRVYEIDVTQFQVGSGPFQARLIAQHDEDVNQIALNETENLLASGDNGGHIKVIELDSITLLIDRLPSSVISSSCQSPVEGIPSNSSLPLCSKTLPNFSASPSDDCNSSGAATPTQSIDVVFDGAQRARFTPRVILSVKKHASACTSLCFRRCSRKDNTETNAADSRLGSVNSFKWQLISGGLDCKLQLIEFQRAGRSVNIFDVNEFGDQDSATFALNPPLIHTVAITSDGAIVACGLENGNIELFDARRKNLAHLQTLFAHSQAVTKVLFVPAPINNGSHNTRVNYLISAGNDGNMFCWELKDAGVQSAIGSGHGHHAQLTHGLLMHQDGISIKVINCVEHWHKINWVEARSIDKVFIGDQSTQIAACSLVP